MPFFCHEQKQDHSSHQRDDDETTEIMAKTMATKTLILIIGACVDCVIAPPDVNTFKIIITLHKHCEASRKKSNAIIYTKDE